MLHYRNLQLYLSLGMKLKKVHSVLAFDQEDWMEPYIRLNTELLRKKATSDFEKDFFKLMNNSVFGKTMENLRNRTIVNLVRANEEKKLQKILSEPLYARSAIFGESLAGIQMHKDHILMSRPVYYDHLALKHGSNCQLLYTARTPSCSRSRPRMFTKTWKRISTTTTRVTFRKTIHYTAQKNKKVLGKMKDKCAGALISEPVCLRSKMYSILLESDKNSKKGKGTTKAVTKKEIVHQNYKDALFKKFAFKHGMNMLRSKAHQINGLHLNKTTLLPFDSKQRIKVDGIHTLAYVTRSKRAKQRFI